MTMVPHPVWLAGFTALMIAAAIVDWRRLVIPNPLVGGLCVLWLLDLETGSQAVSAALATVGCAAAVFAGGALLFARGLIGGGDVKLLAAASLWAGAEAVPPLLVMTALIGGLLALFLLTPLGARLAARRAGAVPISGGNAVPRTPVPYGVAIAAAALAATLQPHFS